MECPRCDGTGVCAECKGCGKTPCPACQGKGLRTTPKGTVFECKSCAASGQIDCSPKCSSCDGSGQITDKLRREVRDKYVVKFDNTSPLRLMTTLLLSLNLTIFVCQQLGLDPLNSFIVRYCYNYANGWTSGEVWRLVLPIFLHGGVLHILMNSWVIFRECPILEGYYGSRRFLALYLVAGIGGNLLSWVGNCRLGGLPVAGIGASGSLFGVGAAIVALHFRWGIFARQQVQTYAGYLVIFILGGFVTHASLLGSSIDNWGHLGGFLAGFVFAWLSPRPSGR